MAQPNPDQQALWRSALADAGLRDEDVDLVITSTAPADPTALAAGVFVPRDDPALNAPLPLTPAEIAELGNLDRYRIAIYGGVEAKFQLALMRWSLELARQDMANSDFFPFMEQVNRSWDGLFVGMGGAVVWHFLPNIDDADLAAGHLVASKFGPQPGGYDGPYGALLRVDRVPGELSTLSRRLVVAAAIYPDEFTSQFSSPTSRDLALNDLESGASAWWSTLLADADFNALRLSSRYYIPSAETLDALVANELAAANEWRPLTHHLRLCLDRGVRVLP